MLRGLKRYLRNLKDASVRSAIVAGLPLSDRELISRIRARNLTYLSDVKLASIATTCRALELANSPGDFIEAGCALGGSAILISALKRTERQFLVYDVFQMIPPPTAADPAETHRRYQTIVEGNSPGLGSDTYYGYQDNLYEIVQSNLRQFGVDPASQNIRLIKGLLEDTMKLDQPVAFAHVDVDWYSPVKASLERIFPRLILGGAIILDDYHDWGGCRKATDEFLRQLGAQVAIDDSAGSMKITRVR